MKTNETKYYDIGPLLKRNRKWNMIMGVRGNGKTYALKKYCLERYFKHKEEFVWVRRTKTQSGPAAMSWLKDMVNDNSVNELIPEGFGLKTSKKYITLYKIDNTEGEKFVPVNIGYFIPLTTQQNFKSVSYHNVNTLVFDEVLTFDLYLSNELFRFQELLSTIERDRDKFKMFLISNNISADNPYFNALKIDLGNIPPGKITNFDKQAAIELCDRRSLELNEYYKKTISSWLGSKTGYSDYAEKGDWAMDDSKHVIKYKGMKKFQYNVIINGVEIGVWTYKKANKNYVNPDWYFSRQLNLTGKTYILSRGDFKGDKEEIVILNGMFAPHWLNQMKQGNFRYESLEIKKRIKHYVVAHMM